MPSNLPTTILREPAQTSATISGSLSKEIGGAGVGDLALSGWVFFNPLH
jgi:hypothetical protein